MLVRQYSRSLPKRSCSSWVRQILGSRNENTKESKNERFALYMFVEYREIQSVYQSRAVEEEAPKLSPPEHLRQLVQVHLPDHYTTAEWSSAPLCHDTHLKTKVINYGLLKGSRTALK